MKPMRQIQQETFDECVRENMEEFDMALEEAIEDAVAQFTSQGVDLANIIKCNIGPAASYSATADLASTTEDSGNLPIDKQLKRIIDQIDEFTKREFRGQIASPDLQQLAQRFDKLQRLFQQIPEAKIVAQRSNQNHAIQKLVQVLKICSSAELPCDCSAKMLKQLVDLLSELVVANSVQQLKQPNQKQQPNDQMPFEGVQLLLSQFSHTIELLKSEQLVAGNSLESESILSEVALSCPSQLEQLELLASLLHCLGVSCAKETANRRLFRLEAHGLDVVCSGASFAAALQDARVAQELAFVIYNVTCSVENGLGFAEMHEINKSLASNHDFLSKIVHLLSRWQLTSSQERIWLCWLPLLKQLLTTEENCKQFDALEGMELLCRSLAQLSSNATSAYQQNSVLAELVKKILSVIQNASASDQMKSKLVFSNNQSTGTGNVQLILFSMEKFQQNGSIQQHGCAILASLALRSPENSQFLMEKTSAVQQIANALRMHHQQDHQVIKQASLAIRNLVARNVQFRNLFLEQDQLEEILRVAQQYRICGDEAYGALRDLGADIQLSSFGDSKAAKPAVNFNPVHQESSELEQTIQTKANAPFAAIPDI